MLSILEGNEGKWFDFEFIKEDGSDPVPFKLKLKPITYGDLKKMQSDNISYKFDKKENKPVSDINVGDLLKAQDKQVVESIIDWKGFKEPYSKENADVLIKNCGNWIVGKFEDKDQTLTESIGEIARKGNDFIGEEENLPTT